MRDETPSGYGINSIDQAAQRQKTATADNCCAGRQSAASVLLERADRLRRQAGEMHEEANRIEQLGRYAQTLQGPVEEALYRLAMDATFGRPPRAF